LDDDGNIRCLLRQALLHSEPTLHAQSRRFTGFERLRKQLHAVSSHENSSIADLEGIVAKWKDAPYNPAALPLSWIKVKNPKYSQGRDRHELFERRIAKTS